MTAPANAVNLPPLRDVIARYGLGARKSLGQHFLLDMNVTARIAREAGNLAEGTTVEVGPGPGGLTRSLLEAGARHVVALEKDRRCIEALEELVLAWPGRLTVIEADALKQDLVELAGRTIDAAAPVRIVANLPYNVATPLLVRWLRDIQRYESLTLMFQKEVADRIVAAPGNKIYGRISVLSQYVAEPRRLFNLPAEAFVPPPKVASSVVRFEPGPEPRAGNLVTTLEAVTAAAFGQRRKMLRQSLKSLVRDPAALLERVGIDPEERAEQLTVTQFAAIASEFAASGGGEG